MTTSIEQGLTIRAVGPATVGQRIPLSELARIALNLQATLERIALSVVGARPRVGRRPSEIAEAVRMDFVGFAGSSAVMQLSPAGTATLDNLLDRSFETLVQGLKYIDENGDKPDGELGSHFTPPVLNGLSTLCGGIGGKGLTRIEFTTGQITHFVLTRDTQTSLRQIQKRSVEAQTTIVGRLHMGDFEPLSLKCRIDTSVGSVWCDFDIDLKDDVFNHLDQLVMASGSAELQSDGAVRVLHLVELTSIETSRTSSLEELAADQGVQSLHDVGELRGAPVDDFEVFLDALRVARGDE
ncbi:hypothetical protein ACFQ1S_09795 [Kibdelosporangium lantanae]|uniref:Uncharacterized protein n=1 Tax=Kibdelosporangium lantanae TaxID=1497396 RepID=A0ABW3M562_9PSEU